MLSLGQGAWADQATVPMPHARRVYHGGQFETTRACGLSDGLIKFFTIRAAHWRKTGFVSRGSGCEVVVEMALALQKYVTVQWKAYARIR